VRHGRPPLLSRRPSRPARGHRDVHRVAGPAPRHQGHLPTREAPLELHSRHQAATRRVHSAPLALISGRRGCSNASSRSERHEDQHPAHPDHARRQHPRPDSITTLLRARLSGQAIDEARLAKHVAEAIGEVVRRQAEVGLDVVSDGEMGKTTFLAYTDERLAGFVPLKAGDPNVPFSNVGGSWARRIDTRREWQAFREYYQGYLPR